MTQAKKLISNAQLAVMVDAAKRPGRSIQRLPAIARGAAWEAVVRALVAGGYAVKCYLPCHVEYALTDKGVQVAQGDAGHNAPKS